MWSQSTYTGDPSWWLPFWLPNPHKFHTFYPFSFSNITDTVPYAESTRLDSLCSLSDHGFPKISFRWHCQAYWTFCRPPSSSQQYYLSNLELIPLHRLFAHQWDVGSSRRHQSLRTFFLNHGFTLESASIVFPSWIESHLPLHHWIDGLLGDFTDVGNGGEILILFELLRLILRHKFIT